MQNILFSKCAYFQCICVGMWDIPVLENLSRICLNLRTFPMASLFLCILSRVWWFFLLLMDYFDKLLLTAPLKNYRNMFSLPYLFFFSPKSLLFWKIKEFRGLSRQRLRAGGHSVSLTSCFNIIFQAKTFLTLSFVT